MVDVFGKISRSKHVMFDFFQLNDSNGYKQQYLGRRRKQKNNSYNINYNHCCWFFFRNEGGLKQDKTLF